MMDFLYRVEPSNVNFKKEEVINASEFYSVYLNDDSNDAIKHKKEIEQDVNFANGNPGIDRSISLFLFNELKDALSFSAKIYKGDAHIYIVIPCDVIYRGDMNILDFINHSHRLGIKESDIDSYKTICNLYWKNVKTFTPCIEYIVGRAVIINEICSSEKCAQFYSGYIDQKANTFLSVERSPVYIETLLELSRL